MNLDQYLKPFTVALALDHNLVENDTIIKNIPRK